MHIDTIGRRMARPIAADMRPHSLRALRALSCALLVVWAGCVGEPEIESPVAVDVSAAPLQSQYLSDNFSGVFPVSGSLGDLDQARATAVIKTRRPEPNIPFGSCGSTFVSPHFAVTAAHCVAQMPIRTVSSDDFFMEEVTIGNLDAGEVSGYMNITGTWGEGAGWGNGTLRQGYSTVRLNQCRVVRRCSTTFGHDRCSLGTPDQVDVDIALIYCPDRTSTRFALSPDIVEQFANIPASTWDQTNQALNIWWFHEIYFLPTDPGLPGVPPDRWEHYGLLDAEDDNFHYTRWHQVIPLLSLAHPVTVDGQAQPLRVLGAAGFPNEMMSNAPVCHGTSGSGVFAHNTRVFLGPVVHPGEGAVLGTRLCDRFNSGQSPDVGRSTYVNATTTGAFLNRAREVSQDLGLPI